MKWKCLLLAFYAWVSRDEAMKGFILETAWRNSVQWKRKSCPCGQLDEKFEALLLRTLVILIRLFRIFWSPKAMPKWEAGTGANFFLNLKYIHRVSCQIITSCCEIHVCGIINRKQITNYNLWRKFVSGKNFLWRIAPSMKTFNFPTVTPQGPTKGAIGNKQEDAGCRALEWLTWNKGREL